LHLLRSEHHCSDPLDCDDENCGRVALPKILALWISQYSARIHDLRHKYGYLVDNGSENGSPDHRWFRLKGRHGYQPHDPVRKDVQADTGLFSTAELERTSRWSDLG